MIRHLVDEREEERAYTWLRERESGERLKASDEGAGMVRMSERRASKEEVKYHES
jgi:hypothetical protein